MRRLTPLSLVAAALLAAAGCDSGSPLERSCAGQAVELCAPYEYAEITTASLDPAELSIADFSMSAHIHVELARCDMAPAPHVVDLSAIVPDTMPHDGGGEGVSVMSLLTLEDGRDGDVAGDDVIDVMVANPFIRTVPEERDITLRFTPRSTAPLGCTGGALDVPYRTGAERPDIDAGP